MAVIESVQVESQRQPSVSVGSVVRGFSRQLGAAVRALLVATVVLGLVWPLAVTGVAQVVARPSATGSLVERDGQVVGSSLIGQKFEGDRWFATRPSASDDAGDTSGGRNLSPVGDTQRTAVRERADALRRANPDAPADIPADALTASGSGLDPDISPAYADWQVPRVATARGLAPDAVRRLVADHTTGRTLGFLGQPRVNVLELNLALDATPQPVR